MKQHLTTILGKIDLGGLLAKNWLLKAVSLVLAVILWAMVGGEDRVDKNVMVPIEIINLPRNLVISNQFKKEIEVSVSGPHSLILEMGARSVTRQIDLSAATPGTMVIENAVNQIPVPRGVTVQRVQPASIILSLDKLIQKQLPITPRTTGRVASGYYLRSLRTDPDLITITGPQTVLANIEQLYTRAINLEGLRQPTQLQVPLQLEANIVELIGETSVTADVTVALDTTTLTLDKVPVQLEGGSDNWQLQPATVRITASIPELLLDSQVDPKSLFFVTAMPAEGDSKLRVQVIPRPDLELPIEIFSIIPATVELVASPEAEETPSPPRQDEIAGGAGNGAPVVPATPVTIEPGDEIMGESLPAVPPPPPRLPPLTQLKNTTPKRLLND
jgi:YbbR domain-containing protein